MILESLMILLNHFFLNSVSSENWLIGWGNNTPLHDAGVENLRQITKVDSKKGKIYLSLSNYQINKGIADATFKK